ncbi:MAG: hypothetical protein AAFU79_17250 [Myxococcota bacterium]
MANITYVGESDRADRRRRACGIAVLMALGLGEPKPAEAAWWDDLEAKAEGWQERIREALERLDEAARRSRDRLAALERERLEALRASFREQAEALEALLKSERGAWGAVLAARSEELFQLIQDTSADLQRILQGTRDHFRDELSRWTTGTRQLLSRAALRAGARLGSVQVINGHVVARHVERAQQRSLQLASWVVGAMGLLIALMGAVILSHRRQRLGLMTCMTGAALLGLSLYFYWGGGAKAGPRLGDEHCPALASPSPSRPALVRCRVLAYDDELAEAVQRKLNRMN